MILKGMLKQIICKTSCEKEGNTTSFGRGFFPDNADAEIELPPVDVSKLKEGDEVLVREKIRCFINKEIVGIHNTMGGMNVGIKDIVAVPPKTEEPKPDKVDWEALKMENPLWVMKPPEEFENVKKYNQLVDIVRKLSDSQSDGKGE